MVAFGAERTRFPEKKPNMGSMEGAGFTCWSGRAEGAETTEKSPGQDDAWTG